MNEPLHTVLMEPDERDQFPIPELMLYSQMTDEDAQGTFSFRVEVRTDSNIIINERKEEGFEVTFVSRYFPVRPYEHLFVVRGVVLPSPGLYHFHVMCGLASMSDRSNSARPAKLRIVQAELPGGM